MRMSILHTIHEGENFCIPEKKVFWYEMYISTPDKNMKPLWTCWMNLVSINIHESCTKMGKVPKALILEVL